MAAYLFVLMSIIISTATAEWSDWINELSSSSSSDTRTITLKSDNNSTITRICANFIDTTVYDFRPYSIYTSISAYFSDNHAALAGDPFITNRVCTNKVNEGECFTSVYVTYDRRFSICGLQLRTSDHILFDILGTRPTLSHNNAITWGVSGEVAAIASGMPHECLTAIDVSRNESSMITRIRFHFSKTDEPYLDNHISDELEDVVSETGWSQWFGSNISTDNVFTFKSHTNAHINQICATYARTRYYTSISAYFSDNHAALAGGSKAFWTDRECTDTVEKGECFTSVYVAYVTSTNYSIVRGLQLRTSNHTLFDFFGAHGTLLINMDAIDMTPITAAEAGIASGMKHECLTGIDVDYNKYYNIISRVRFHFSQSGYLEDDVSDTSDLGEVASDKMEDIGAETGWSQWFGSNNATDELITLKSDHNGTITQICATFEIFDKSVDYFTSISAYFDDEHAALAGDASSLWTDRQCTDAVNDGECFTSVYVTYDSAVRGVQLMTSDDVLFDFFGARINNISLGQFGGIASGKQHECLTGIAVNYWNHTLFSQIRFHFSGSGDSADAVSNDSDFGNVVSDPPDLWNINITNQSDLEQVVRFKRSTTIKTTQILTTLRTSATTKQQVIVVNIDKESDDWSQVSNILSAAMIVIIVCICLTALVYKMCGNRSQRLIARNDEKKLEIEVKKHESFDIDLKIEDEADKKRNDGETVENELKKRKAPTPKKKKRKKKRAMSTH